MIATKPKHANSKTAIAGSPRQSGAGTRAILYLAFTLSGLAGLIYESTWTRYLQLFLGHAAYAQVLVLALFMGGMGAGALLTGRIGPRISPLAAYAAIEGLLGIFALVFHPLYTVVTAFAYDTLLPGTLGSISGQIEQWTLAAILILPQSILLGMTFPLMSAAILRLGAPQPGRVFAMLYFTNSAGAVIGVLLAGFWLIESDGLRAAMRFAGLVNLAVAALALLVSRRRAPMQPALERAQPSPGAGRWMLAIAFLTAVSSFLYEIGWLRMLALVQGASTHAFETMLSAFILGLALGGLWIRSRISRFESPVFILALVQLSMGLAALATLPAYPFAFDAMARTLPWLRSHSWGYESYNVLGYLIAAAIMVPASFFAGMTLPLLTHVLYERGRGESEIGAVYGWNTLGGIAGIALGGLVLMPVIGLKNMIVLGSAIDIALGLALVAWLARSDRLPARRTTFVLASVAVVAAVAALRLFELDPLRLASGVFRTGHAALPETSKIAFHADGRTATVTIEQAANQQVSIATNGKVDGAIQMARALGNPRAQPTDDEYTMTLLSVLPLAYAPQAKQAAIIGHGSGLSTHVMLGSPAIEHVDVIEIEPEMINAARAFRPRVERAYTDSRSQFHIGDARAFFARSPRKYDIIVSEPSNPWVSGVASLYTPEFYRQARTSLAPGGLFVQWFHLYEFDRPMVRSIVGAIGRVFPDYLIYGSNENDVVLVATASGAMPPITDAIFGWPKTSADLGYLGFHSPDQLRLMQVASRRAYAPLLEGGPVNSDYYPMLEFGAERARFANSDDSTLIALARDPVPILEILSGFAAPRPTPDSPLLTQLSSKFRDLDLCNAVVRALAGAPGAQTESALPDRERSAVQAFRKVPSSDAEADWNDWFTALFNLSMSMISNGGWPALEAKLTSEPMASALHRAPEAVRNKVEFLTLVGRRDLGQIRQRGRALLDGSMRQSDPAFHAYTLVATVTACLANTPDQECRSVISSLDRVLRKSPVVELLRAHQRALR